MLGDLRYTFRSLRRDQSFSAVVIVSLALAIGLSTSVFTIANSFLLRPLPVKHPERLVALYTLAKERDFPGNFSWLDLDELRKERSVFADVFGHGQRSVRMLIDKEPELAIAETVSANYFTGLGARPAAGRLFEGVSDDLAFNRVPEAVLSYAFWQRRFRGDPGVVGRSIRVNDQQLTVVGVGPRGLSGTRMLDFLPDVWIPLSMQAIAFPDDKDLLSRRAARWLTLRARLQPGVSIEQARKAVEAMAVRWNSAWPTEHKSTRVGVALAPGKFHAFFHSRGYVHTVERLLFGIIALILLLACANVASLTFARATTRAKELAVRASLGAGRARLVRQLFSESLLLGLLGGLLGLGLAVWLTVLQMELLPQVEFTAFDADELVRLDWRVALFTASVSVLAAMAFGVLPAWRASYAQPAEALRSSRGEPAGPARTRAVLVAVQVALCCVLLTTAGLFMRSLHAGRQLDPGFQTDRLLMASFDLNLQGYDSARGREFHRRLIDELRARQGIEAASVAFPLPLDIYTSGTSIVTGDAPGTPGAAQPESRVFVFNGLAGPGYFDVMRTPIVAGRAIGTADNADAPLRAVINQAMANRCWPGQDPLGRTFRLAGDAQRRPVTVIGVARDGKYVSIGEAATPFFWTAPAQQYGGRMRVIVRTAGRPESAVAALRSAIRSVDPAVPLYGIQTGSEFLRRPLTGIAILASIASLFGIVALLLATVGLYGMIQYNQARRRREFGIRAAVGATALDLAILIAGSGFRLTLIGAAAGLAGAYAGARLLSALLVGVDPRDPFTFCAVIAVEFGAAAFACLSPAIRAARVSPAETLRAD